MGKKPPKWLPGERVDETILLQRKSVEQLRADRNLRKDSLKEQKERMKAKRELKRKQKLSTKRFLPAQVVLKQADKRTKNTRRFWKAGEKFDTRAAVRGAEKLAETHKKAHIALVVRAKGNMIPPVTKAAFRRLGLDKIYKARLMQLNPTNHKIIQQLRRFIILGYPTNEQLERLVRTRGSFWNSETKSKAFISGNLQVEEKLGHLNILSISELVDNLWSKTEHCDTILKQMAPFDFHPPRALHAERHRSVHEKLEVLNPQSFAKYLEEQLSGSATGKAAAVAKRKKSAATASVVDVPVSTS
jgi:large subunit ribosomal protein L7e